MKGLKPFYRWLIAGVIGLAIVNGVLGLGGFGAFLGLAGVLAAFEIAIWPAVLSSWYAFWHKRNRPVYLNCGRLGALGLTATFMDFRSVDLWRGPVLLCNDCAAAVQD